MADHVILFPPLTDFTLPPEHLARLKAQAVGQGLVATAIDMNVRTFAEITAQPRLSEWINTCEARISALAKRLNLTYWEQQELLALSENLADGLKTRDVLGDLVPTLREPDRHFQAPSYSQAVKAFDGVLKLASAVSFPFRFVGCDIVAPFLTHSSQAADRFRAIDPFRPVYDRLVAELQHQKPSSITLVLEEPSQFLPAISLAATLQAALPTSALILTGAFASQLLRDGDAEALGLFHRHFMAVVDDESEPLWGEVVVMAAEGKAKALANVSWAPSVKVTGKGKVATATAAVPDYSDFALSDYPTPELVLAYRPTRGRHQSHQSLNFIDFKASSEPLDPTRVTRDLAELQQRHGTRLFNLVGDWLTPTWLDSLVAAVTERNLSLKWAATVTSVSVIDGETAARWHSAGCVSICLGLNECRDPAISDIREQSSALAHSLENLAHAGIATQLGFVLAFPGESEEHARAGIDLLRSHSHEIDLARAGDARPAARFVLTAKAAGTVEHFFFAGEELRCFPELTRLAGIRARLASEAERITQSYATRRWPFAGAVGSAHTLLAFERFGRKALSQSHRPSQAVPPRPMSEGDRVKLSPNAKMLWIPYQLSVLQEIATEERELRDHELRRRLRDLGAERVWSYSAREDLRMRAGQRSPHVLAPGMPATEITLAVADLIALISEQFLPVSQLLARAPREARDATRRVLDSLHQHGALLTEFQARREQGSDTHRGAQPGQPSNGRPNSGGGNGGGGNGGGGNGGGGNGGGGNGGGNGGPGGNGRRRRRRRRGRGRGEGVTSVPTPQNA